MKSCDLLGHTKGCKLALVVVVVVVVAVIIRETFGSRTSPLGWLYWASDSNR